MGASVRPTCQKVEAEPVFEIPEKTLGRVKRLVNDDSIGRSRSENSCRNEVEIDEVGHVALCGTREARWQGRCGNGDSAGCGTSTLRRPWLLGYFVSSLQAIARIWTS